MIMRIVEILDSLTSLPLSSRKSRRVTLLLLPLTCQVFVMMCNRGNRKVFDNDV